MNWTFTNDRPIYLQLTERLEREIASGTLAPGSWVPPVRELAGKLGISPNTVQRAMYEMERSGLIVSRGTEGKTITEDTARIESIRQDLARQTLEAFYRRWAGWATQEKKASGWQRNTVCRQAERSEDYAEYHPAVQGSQ